MCVRGELPQHHECFRKKDKLFRPRELRTDENWWENFSVVRLDMDKDIGCRHRPHRCHRRIVVKLMETITDDVHKISCKNYWLRLVGGHFAAMTETMWHSTEWYELRVAFCETGISNRFNRKWFCDVNLTARQSIDGCAVCGHNVLKLKSQHPRQRRSDHYFIRFFFVFSFFVPSNCLNWCDTVKVENIFGNRNQTIDDSVVAPIVRSPFIFGKAGGYLYRSREFNKLILSSTSFRCASISSFFIVSQPQ